MSARLMALVITSVLLLGACSGKKADDASTTAAAPEQTAPTRQKTVFDDQLKAIEKAKAVQKQLEDDKNKRDKAMEDQGT